MIWSSSTWETCLFFPTYLFSHLFVSLQIHKCTWGYNSALLHFATQIILDLAMGALSVGCCVRWPVSIIVCGPSCVCFSTSLLSGPIRYSWLILCISCTSPRSKKPWFLLLENDMNKNQDLGAKYCHCHWDSLLLSLLSLQIKEMCVYIITFYMDTSTNISKCNSVSNVS